MYKPKISVIIPTYKPQAYLYECLGSLVNQTIDRSFFEVILVLNGCTNPWKSQIADYIASNMQGMNVNFIHTEQGGVSNARNIALDNAKGEYVTFIDDDDFVSARYLELLYEKVDRNVVSLCRPYAFNDGNVSTPVPYPMVKIYEEMCSQTDIRISSKVRKYFSGPWMKLISMSIIQDRRFDIRFKNGEDTLYMFLISDRIRGLNFADREAVYYRRYREGSAVTGKRKRSEVIKTGILQIGVYLKYFIRTPFCYNWIFLCTRLLSTIRGVILNCK